MWEDIRTATGGKPTVERRKGGTAIPQKSLPQKTAYLTIKIIYHPAVKCDRCRYLYTRNSITQQIFLDCQLCAKNPLGHRSVDSESNSV